MKTQTVVAVLIAISLTGCSSSPGKRPAASTPNSRTSSAPSYTPSPGDDAALIAQHIVGCSGVLAGDIGGGASTALSSTATCTLDGHLVIVDSFNSEGAGGISSLASPGTTYATGGSWVAFLADQGQTAATTTLQMQITNDAGGLLQQETDGTTPTPASADAQHIILKRVADDLHGTLEHGTATN